MRNRDDEFDLDESDDLDEEDGDSGETLPCPHCFGTIYDDSERCPHCGEYLSREDAPRPPPPWWVILGVGISLVIVFRWIVQFR